MDALLSVENLSKAFAQEQILRDLDFSMRDNSIVTIVGKSGSGKSVFLRALAGLHAPDTGTITLNGQQIFPKSTDKNWREHLGYLFQGNALFDHLSVFENIAMPLVETTGKKSVAFRQKIEDLLERLDLVSAAHKKPNQISGGMSRRVALARCLIRQPKLILFDEPTTGLDPLRTKAVFEMIRKYRDELGFSALIVSHDIPESLEIADQTYVLRNYKLEELQLEDYTKAHQIFTEE